MFDYKQNIKDDVKCGYKYKVKMILSDEEVKNINKEISTNNLLNTKISLIKNEIEIIYDPIISNNANLQYKFPNIPTNMNFSFLTKLQKNCVSIYSNAQVSLSCRDIDTIKATDLDGKVDKSIKTPENLGNEIKQLFIDIQTNDANDLLCWVKNNNGKIPTEDVISPRLNRFNAAFYEIFSNNLSFDRVESVNNKKEVFFKNNGKDVKIDDLSSGEKQIIYRGAFLLKDKSSLKEAVVLIDEPEISMHPKWQLNILNYYKCLFKDDNIQTSQIFLTSHSEYIFKNKNKEDLIFLLNKDFDKINIKKYEEHNILPFNNFSENKYFAFDVPTIEFFNELYAYIGWKTKLNVDDYILQFKSQISGNYIHYCNLISWHKDNGKSINITPITYLRHEIHHPENKLNTKIYKCDNDLKEPIEFLLYLIRTFHI